MRTARSSISTVRLLVVCSSTASRRHGGQSAIAAVRGGLQASGLDLKAAGDAGVQLPRLRSLLVSWRGDLVLERYYNGASRDRLANIKSASKSVISTLVGIALERKLIADVKTPIVTCFPELARDRDPAKRDITVEHLLAMRSGLEGTSNRNYGAWVTSRNWVQHALARPMFAPPGEAMEYSTGQHAPAVGDSDEGVRSEHVAVCQRGAREAARVHAGAVAARSAGRLLRRQRHADDAASDAGARPAVSDQGARQRPAGRSGAVGRALMRRAGARTAALERHGRSDARSQVRLGWWVYEIGGYDTCFAWGYGGQYVFVVPELDLVIVTTSSPDVSEERRGHRQLVFDILDRLVVAPIARASGS